MLLALGLQLPDEATKNRLLKRQIGSHFLRSFAIGKPDASAQITRRDGR